MSENIKSIETSIEIDGSTIRVLEEGEGEVVVLGHGWLWDAEMWRPQIDVLSQHYRVVVPELWGHGGSGRLPPKTSSLRDIARQYLRALDYLGISRFAFAGLSVGGMWGAELACLAPGRLRALALIDTFVGAEPPASQAQYFAMLDIVAAVGSVPPAIVDEALRQMFSPEVARTAPDLPELMRARLERANAERLLDSVVPLGRMIFGRRDALKDLALVNVPTVVITGSQDVARPVHEGQMMASALNCRFVKIQGAGHTSSLEAPKAINRELVAFLASAGAFERAAS